MSGLIQQFVKGLCLDVGARYKVANSKTWSELHLAQGELDSACGLHSILMAAMLLTGTARSKVIRLALSRSGPLGALWKSAEPDLFSHGTDARDLVRYVRAFGPPLTAEVAAVRGNAQIAIAAVAAIEEGWVPVIDFSAATWAHWTPVVGAERQTDSERAVALLLVDPGAPRPTWAPYNGRIALLPSSPRRHSGNALYPLTCRYQSGERHAVRLRRLIVVGRAPP